MESSGLSCCSDRAGDGSVSPGRRRATVPRICCQGAPVRGERVQQSTLCLAPSGAVCSVLAESLTCATHQFAVPVLPALRNSLAEVSAKRSRTAPQDWLGNTARSRWVAVLGAVLLCRAFQGCAGGRCGTPHALVPAADPCAAGGGQRGEECGQEHAGCRGAAPRRTCSLERCSGQSPGPGLPAASVGMSWES